MFGMVNRNLLYSRKIIIVILVSSSLSKDGLPAPSERVFFAPFSERPKKKPAIDNDAGFPVFSLPSS
jgi:hypothetical protein